MADTSDFEKLTKAFGEVATAFGSWENLLDAFGLLHMPAAQRYGILFGCITFTCTIAAVLCLLTFGGSFQRIAEQQKGDATIPHAHQARSQRALLLERLLDARERMMKYYPPTPIVTDGFTNLTKMLMNAHPKIIETDSKDEKKDGESTIIREYPDDYQNNYQVAYRLCQDSPGGELIH
jgi:hypothetical protein